MAFRSEVRPPYITYRAQLLRDLQGGSKLYEIYVCVE